MVTAGRWKHGRQRPLIETDGQDRQTTQREAFHALTPEAVSGSSPPGAAIPSREMSADFLDQGKEFAGCGSEIELFRFEVALWHDHKIHGRRQ